MNSPFFLAIETGVLVGGITQLYNWARTRSDRRAAEEKAKRDKQNALLTSVADEIPIYVSAMGSTRKLKGWLEDPKNQVTDARDAVGRSRDQVLALYSDFFKLTLGKRSPNSILIEVGIYFESLEVCRLVGEVDGAIEKVHGAKTDVERLTAVKDEERVFRGLLEAMSGEIKHPIKADKKPEKQPGLCLHAGEVSAAR